MATQGGQLSKSTLVVLNKLKKHPYYKSKDVKEEDLIMQAENLSDPEYIRCQFSYLLESINRIVVKTGLEEEPDQDLTSLETEAVRKQDVDCLTNAMNIPVKLILRQLHHTRPPLANKLSQLIRCEYGPLHSTLQVGEISIEWGNDGLVIPSMLPQLPGDLETQAPKQSQWYRQTKQLTEALDVAERRKDHTEKFNIMFTSMSEKAQIIDGLVDVIISYNCEKTYNLFKCNCQHFTHDALLALGYKDAIRFSGKMNDYFEQLKAGKLTVPEEYSTHENLDEYVQHNLEGLSLPDMEYLLCQYFKHHLPSMEQMRDQDSDDWRCDVQGCQSERLDSIVNDRSSFALSHAFSIEREQEEILGKLPEELQEEVTLENQEMIMKKIKGGYRDRVLYKLQQHPNKDLVKQEDIIDKLTEREKFRESFCSNVVEGRSEMLVVETATDFQRASITEKEARERVKERMKIFCNFPVKLLLYCTKRKSPSLTVALQVGNSYFEWSKSSLIIPAKVDELTSTKPVLKLPIPQEGVWSSYVGVLQPRIAQALKLLDYDALIDLQYQLAHKKDELLYALIDLAVKYNRTNGYSQRKCNNGDFIRDAQLALGVAEPAKVSKNVHEHLKKVTQAWRKQSLERLKIENHNELDKYTYGTIKMEVMTQETLDYFIGQYFTFHVSGWEKEDRSCMSWSCIGENCMLPTLEDMVDLFMW